MPERNHSTAPQTHTRRTVLIGLAVGATAAGSALFPSSAEAAVLPDPNATPNLPPTSVLPPTRVVAPGTSALVRTTQTLAQARARALASVGLRRARSSWAAVAPTGPWNAAHAAWVVDPRTRGPVDAQSIYAQAKAAGELHSAARVGALAVYETVPGQVSHVGFVDSITSYGAMIIAGDVGAPLPSDQTFVRRFVQPPGSGGPIYLYPAYAG